MKDLTILAIGGNAIDADSYKEEGRNILRTINGIEKLIQKGPLIITHGNGPQVGKELESTKDPLDICTAKTQGSIGSLIALNLRKHLEKNNIEKPVLCITTHVVVDKNDKTLQNPSKPIGEFIVQKKEAIKLMNRGYKIEKDSAGRGWRHVVASPHPVALVEEVEIIDLLLKKGCVVIIGGGGGIPTYRSKGRFVRVKGVVDKDFTSSLVASKLKAKSLILLTEVEGVFFNFGKKNKQLIRNANLKDIEILMKNGHFKTGMDTKIKAAVDFLKKGGEKVFVGHVFKLKEILNGKMGTKITKGENQK